MIIRDFNWESYNRSSISWFLIFVTVFSGLFNNISILFKHFNNDIMDIKYLSWLGVESSWIFYFFGEIILNYIISC